MLLRYFYIFSVDKDSSFYAYSVMKHTRNILFNSMHNDWYICESEMKGESPIRQKLEIILDFYNGDPDVLDRCTFLLHPIPQTHNMLDNCKGVIGPVPQRMINGELLPKSPPLVQVQPPLQPPPPAVIVPPVVYIGGLPGQAANTSSTITTANSGSTGVTTKPPISNTTRKSL